MAKLPNEKKRKSSLAEKALRYIRAKEAGKRGYQRADRLLQEIAEETKPGEAIALNDVGRKAVLIDKFADKNIVWTPCGARRFDLEIVEP